MTKLFDSELVSIITPTYNAVKFINSTVESVLNQDFRNWELIIIDDYSTDGTQAIIEVLALNENRIRVIYLNENKGPAFARNQGLLAAKGKYIAFLDSDDLWLPQKLSVQMAFMEKYNFPISFSSYEVFSDKSNTVYTIKSVEKLNYHDYLKNTIIGCSTVIINREIVGEFNFREDMRTRQDTKLWLTLLKKGFDAYGVNEVLVKYRTHEQSISNNKMQAALKVWNLYYEIEKLGFVKSIYYYSYYAVNAVLKRL